MTQCFEPEGASTDSQRTGIAACVALPSFTRSGSKQRVVRRPLVIGKVRKG